MMNALNGRDMNTTKASIGLMLNIIAVTPMRVTAAVIT
jgi:hypothetical protein